MQTALVFVQRHPTVHIVSTSSYELTRVDATLAACSVDDQPERLIGAGFYDGDLLDERLAEDGVERLRRITAIRRSPPRWAAAPSLQAEMESSATHRLVAELPSDHCLVRALLGKSPGFRLTRLFSHLAPSVFIGPLVENFLSLLSFPLIKRGKI